MVFCQLCVVQQGLFPFTTFLCTPKKVVGPSECGNLFTGLYFNHSRILTIRPLDQTSLEPRPFWPHKEGSGEYARKCLAGMPRLLNPSNCIFTSSMSGTKFYYIHFLSLVELQHCLIGWLMQHSTLQRSRHFQVRLLPRPFLTQPEIFRVITKTNNYKAL